MATKVFDVFGDIDIKGGDGSVRKLKDVTGEAKKYEGVLTSSAAKAASAAIGLAAVAFGAASVKSYNESQVALVKLQNTLSNMPKLEGETTAAFTEQASAIQRITAASDDAIVSGMAMLGTFQITGEEIRDITPLVVDYSRKFGVDMVTAASSVGKALDGQIGALKRNGVSIDETAYKVDRFAAVQAALRDQVGGFAEQEAESGAVATEQLANTIDDLKESIGEQLSPYVIKAVKALDGMVSSFVDMDEGAQDLIIGITGVSTVVIVALPLLAQMKTALSVLGVTAAATSGSLGAMGAAASLAAGGAGLLELVAVGGAAAIAVEALAAAAAGLAGYFATTWILEITGADKVLADFGSTIGETIYAMNAEQIASNATVESWKEMGIQLDENNNITDEGIEQLRKLNGSTRNVTASTGELAGEMGEAATEAEEYARALDGTMVAADSLAAGMRNLTELDLAKRTADLNLIEAQQRLQTVMADGTSSAEDIARAQLGVEKAELAAKDAAYDMGTAIDETLGTAYDNTDSIASINAVAAALQAAMIKANNLASAARNALSIKYGATGTNTGGALARHGGGVIDVSGSYSLQKGEMVLRETQVERLIDNGGSVTQSANVVIIADPRYTDMARLENDVRRVNSGDVASGGILAALGIG